MKKINIFLIIILCIFFTINLYAEDKNFASKDIIEYGGSISAAGSLFAKNQYKKSEYYLNISPIFNYYFVDKIHIGITPHFGYSHFIPENNVTFSSESTKFVSFGPLISAGYTFKISENLFLDLSPEFQYQYGKAYFINSSLNGTNQSIYYGFLFSSKIRIGNTLFNINLYQGYFDFFKTNMGSNTNFYRILLGFGISTYF